MLPAFRQAPHRREEFRALLAAVGLMLAGGALLLGLNVKMPRAGEPVALLFPPQLGAGEVLARVARLDGLAIRPGGASSVLIAVFPRDIGLGELWRQDVLLSLDPLSARGCRAPEIRDT